MLFSEPLGPLIQSQSRDIMSPRFFYSGCTANWRGYKAFWSINSGALHLLRVVASPCDPNPKDVPPSEYVEGQSAPVLARWFTGDLIVPLGKQVQYVHAGYASQYERYLVITIVDGKVTHSSVSAKRPK